MTVPLGSAERLLGVGEDVVPEARLEMALQLRQVEARGRALGHDRLGVVEDVEAEIEQRGRHRLAVDQEVVLGQVPAARAHQQDGRLVGQLVGLAGGRRP